MVEIENSYSYSAELGCSADEFSPDIPDEIDAAGARLTYTAGFDSRNRSRTGLMAPQPRNIWTLVRDYFIGLNG
jgi:hypothetical protein